jgi:AraC-like DNA-binding protein
MLGASHGATDLICATFRWRLVIVCQVFVRACRTERRRDRDPGQSGNFVSGLDSKRLGPIPSASGGITRLAYARATEAGVELESLLKKAGLTRQQIEDPGVRLRVRDQISFLNLVANAIKDDFLGLHLAQAIDLREIGFLYYVSASSELLSEALERTARYCSIVNEGLSLKCIGGEDVGMTLHYVGVGRHLDRHQIEFFVTTLVRMCRQLTGLRLVPIRVRLAHHRDGDCSEFSEFFGAKVEFGAGVDEVAFATTIKHMPIASADPYLNQFLITYCEEALSRRPTHRGSFRSSVENAIVPLLPHGKARVGEIAQRLGVSQRTFARRLSSEGLTYSDALENLRSNLAERYLTEETLSISQIAWLLGYQEVSAFTHAFKRWTGKTPREVRSRVAS